MLRQLLGVEWLANECTGPTCRKADEWVWALYRSTVLLAEDLHCPLFIEGFPRSVQQYADLIAWLAHWETNRVSPHGHTSYRLFILKVDAETIKERMWSRTRGVIDDDAQLTLKQANTGLVETDRLIAAATNRRLVRIPACLDFDTTVLDYRRASIRENEK